MEMHAYTKTVNDLFSVKKKYVVPRFQREYSWEKEQIETFWFDICENIKIEPEGFKNFEYFIGALVLVGNDNSFEMQIVDGQQRLTTITILLSVIIDKLKNNEATNIAESMFNNYVLGDDDGTKYFKLVNESPKPYFQKAIQNIDKQSASPITEEELTLKDAYELFQKLLSESELKNAILKGKEDIERDGISYVDCLKAVREQVLKYLKFIWINVAEEDEAYVIFETLNSRGIDLTPLDLIKNQIFKRERSTLPDDDPKRIWGDMRKVLVSRDKKVNIDSFFRHFWLSKYSFCRDAKIFQEFKKIEKEPTFNTKDFLDDLFKNADFYNKIENPSDTDFNSPDLKCVYRSFKAFNVFNVTQLRSILLCLNELYADRKINFHTYSNVVNNLEKFHFQFTAICSKRASGLEKKFSSVARESRTLNRNQLPVFFEEQLTEFLKEKRPTYSEFEAALLDLEYEKNKRLIQYIFTTYENFHLSTGEIEASNFSLEHIANRSDISVLRRNSIGNLLPLAQKINGDAGTEAVEIKLGHYENSRFHTVQEFIEDYQSKGMTWNDDAIDERSKALAKIFYDKVWNI